jgi:hypothetical protein
MGGAGYAKNAHSLIFETLAETGIPGGLLIVVFLGTILVATFRRALRGVANVRVPFAAAAAACAAATVSLATDWSWQIAVVPLCMVAVAAPALGNDSARRSTPRTFAGLGRLAILAGAAAALVSIVIPLAMTSDIRSSQAAAAPGAYGQALADARTATNVEPYAATPWLQQALVLEAAGHLAGAEQAALHAERNEPANWQPPLILARIQAERHEIRASVGSARRALLLNPSLSSYLP